MSNANSQIEEVDLDDENIEQDEKKNREPEVAVFKLIGTKKTQWLKQGTEKSENPEAMEWPGLCRIIPTSVVMVKDGDTFINKPIRHIMGNPIIDVEEQEKKGAKPDVTRDNIWFVNGYLSVRNYGSDVGAFKFLKNYEGNVSNPNRPDGAEDEFEEIVAEKVAEIEVVEYADVREAFGLLDRMVSVDKINQKVTYDKEMLSQMVQLLKIDTTVGFNQQFSEIQKIAQSNPTLITESYLNPRKLVVLNILKAEKLGVIFFDDRQAVYADKTVILPYRRNYKKEFKIKALSEFYFSEEGKKQYDQLLIKTKAAEDDSLKGN